MGRGISYGWRVASPSNKMTMAMGSIMLQYVRDYKRDPSDETIAFNACDVSPANIGANEKGTFF